MQISRENLEKSYLDSMYVISHSHNTVKSYKTKIHLFRIFLKENYDIDEYALVDYLNDNKLDILKVFKEFVIYLDKTGRGPSTIRQALSVNRSYLRHMGIKIDPEDLKQVVKVPKVVRYREIPLEKEIILRLLRNARPKLQLAILIAVSTGMRIGEIAQLKISDVDFASNPTKIYIRANTTKTRQAREAFLTTEATNALKDFLKRYRNWVEDTKDPNILEKEIFGTIYRCRGPFIADSAIKGLQVELKDSIRSISDLNVKKENGQQAYHFHAFRKFFRTTVGNAVGRDFAEAIMGHQFYLDTYYQLSEEKKKEMFLEAELYLTVSDFKAAESNFKTLSIEYAKLKQKIEQVQNYLNEKSIMVP